MLILRVAKRCSLIQYQDRGVFYNRPGDSNPLNLTAGQLHSIFPEHRVIALRQFQNKFMTLGRFCCGNHFILGGAWTPHANVVQNALFEQEVVLEYKTDGIH